GSHRREREMRLRWKLDPNPIPWPHFATRYDHTHDPGLADEVPLLITIQDGGHQSRLKVIQLGTRVSQPGHFHHRLVTQMEPRTCGKPEQVDAARRDVFAHIAGRDEKAFFP